MPKDVGHMHDKDIINKDKEREREKTVTSE